MGLLKSLRARLSNRGMRDQQRNGKLQKLQTPSKDQKDEDSTVSRKQSIARKPLPLQAKVKPDVLEDSLRPATPPKDGVNDMPASTIRLVGHERKDADTATPVKKASSRVPTTAGRPARGGAAPSKLDPRADWGEVPSSHSSEKDSEEKLNDGDNKALLTPSAVAGLSLKGSEDTDYHATHAKGTKTTPVLAMRINLTCTQLSRTKPYTTKRPRSSNSPSHGRFIPMSTVLTFSHSRTLKSYRRDISCTTSMAVFLRFQHLPEAKSSSQLSARRTFTRTIL
jgi:hypothetical protein